MSKVTVIGAGLAGSEAAYQLAQAGVEVLLCEMKPEKKTPAHKSEKFGELVCSNSLRGAGLENAPGLLKEEMRRLHSLIMEAADATRVEAGGALAVDREAFETYITDKLTNHPNIKIKSGEITEIPKEGFVIVATGPLSSEAIAEDIRKHYCDENLSFFDAAAPIVSFESIDKEKVFFQSRYDKGGADYINCPLNEEQYKAFHGALVTAETAELHGFEDDKVFEGCMPIEVMAKRGEDTMRYGPMKPVGLVDPKTGKEPYAAIQLRKDNAAGSLYNMVGFQTHLKFGEQKRVFSMIPGLENAEFVRYGVMHRNTYLHSPGVLDHFYRTKKHPNIFFAGQMTGVEGYLESASSGLLAGLSCARIMSGEEPIDFTAKTAIGALAHYISNEGIVNFQPMNVNYGIMDTPRVKAKGRRAKREALSAAALTELSAIIERYAL